MLFFNWLGWLRSGRRARTAPYQRMTPRTKRRSSRPWIEMLEDRTVPAVLPLPQIDNWAELDVVSSNFAAHSLTDAKVAIDPTNPNKLVAVASYSPTSVNNGPGVALWYSTDAGANWQSGSVLDNIDDPRLFTGNLSFTVNEDASVAWDRLGNIYVVSSQHNAANDSGALVVTKLDFDGGSPVEVSEVVLHRWLTQDQAYNPVVAIDTNLPTFTDPVTGATQTDTMANNINSLNGAVPKAIYVAWNQNYTLPQNSNPTLRSSIMVSASGDGGFNFTTPQFVSSATPAAAPQIAFTQGSADGAVPGGQLMFFWSGSPSAAAGQVRYDQIVVDTTSPDGGVASAAVAASTIFTSGFGGTIGDAFIPAATPPNNAPVTTAFPLNVNIADPNFGTVDDLDVTLNIVHPHLNHLEITLTSPTGVIVTLLRPANNFVNGNAIANQGLPDVANMGVLRNGTAVTSLTNNIGTVFNQDAPRSIRDTTATTPFAGHFRPDNGNLDAFNGLSVADANGIWILTITDHIADGANNQPEPLQFVNEWSLNLTSHIDTNRFGPDVLLPTQYTNAADQGATTVSGGNGAAAGVNNTYQLNNPVTGTPGVGPGISVAIDNSLGSFSPNQGTIYVAYTGYENQDAVTTNGGRNTDVFLLRSTNGGTTWSSQIRVNDDRATDNFSEGNRAQFMPQVAVDPLTGTLVVTWFDGRYDAARARVANFIATSLDGGNSFGPQTFINQPKTALNAITGENVIIEPIPGNLAQAGALGFGDHQGLAVYGGRVYPVFASNFNAAGTRLFTADVRIAAGPRLLYEGATMGPIAGTSFSSFTVLFDRPIDPSTFGLGDVTVIYRDQNGANPTSIALAPTNPIVPLDLGAGWGPRNIGTGISGNPMATQFRIQLAAPQTAIGTYSYAIGPNIRDSVRNSASGALGTLMDQNGNAVTAEGSFDSFAVPRPESGVPFAGPFDLQTLPIMVTGPRLTGLGGNVVLNGTRDFLDVTFNQDMNTATFTPVDVLQMIGPLGAIAGPFTVTPLNLRTFRIGFTAQRHSGTYSIILGSDIQSATGHRVDTNRNAGLDALRGTGTAGHVQQEYNAPDPLQILPGQTLNATLTVPEFFIIDQDAINHIQLQLKISHQNVPDLEGQLIAPDGTVIQLFTGVGIFGSMPHANFNDTIFDDFANNPIQNAGTPIGFGPFNPQLPLSALNGLGSQFGGNGTWTLSIKNNGGLTGTLDNWSLFLPKATSTDGLGELVADQSAPNFRIFTQSPTNELSSQDWTAVGPAVNAGGRIGGLAFDPSDPTGNTVYVAGASGGVWKTSNFMTTIGAPTYVQLTDFGPVNSLNVGSMAVFGRNGDPNQSIVFVATGEGDTFSPGVGFLRSMDGGRTWQVLDSTNNVDAANPANPADPDSIAKMSSPQRDHLFVGSTSFKIVVDPTALPNGEVAVYAAIAGSAAQAGLWRSTDTGKTWTRIRAGQAGGDGGATDVVLAPGSRDASGNLDKLYAAFRNEGIFFTTSPRTALSLTQLTGNPGVHPLFRDLDPSPPDDVPIPVANPLNSPNGAFGRIVLATPHLTNNALQDTLYQGWLYAVVVEDNSRMRGLYVTKDFGANWTKVRIPVLTIDPTEAYPTNDESLPDYDPLGSPLFAQGNYDVSLAVDPNNPHVVYIGGIQSGQPQPTGGMIRVDTTTMGDPYALVPYDNSDPGTGLIQFTANTGPASVKPAGTSDRFLWDIGPGEIFGILPNGGAPRPGVPVNANPGGFFDLLRDPLQPFTSPSSLQFTNVARFNNVGDDARWMPFNGALAGSTDQHELIVMRDPLSGGTRLIFGDDQGVYTGVDRGDGRFISSVGTAPLAFGSRNGNLQIMQLYYGAAQPSTLAADIAGSMFYATAQDTGFPRSSENVLSTGNLGWGGPWGDGTGIATDQTGSGTSYTYQWGCCGTGPLPTDFFKVQIANGAEVSRTTGLIQPGDNPGQQQGQWPFLGGFNFHVNPIDGTAILISSSVGRVFRTSGPTTGTGVQWFVVGEPGAIGALGGLGDLDGGNKIALAFGSPRSATPGVLNDFIYAGSSQGRIFVTTTGGGAGRWRNISAGLDGSAVQVVVPNPRRDSNEAYAVTSQGVYWMPDSSVPNPAWIRLNNTAGKGALFGLQRPVWRNLTDLWPTLTNITSLAVDWRFAIPDANGVTHPVLYVGGNGGVFRSRDHGSAWTYFPELSTDEFQTVTIDPTVTEVTFSFHGIPALPLPFTAATTAAQVQAALESIPILAGNVLVSGSAGGPYAVTFLSQQGHRDVPLLTAVSVGGATAIVQAQNGGPGRDELQTVSASGAVASVLFSYNGLSGAPMAFSAATTAADIEANLQSLPVLAGNVAVSGQPGGPFTVVFVNGLGNQDVILLTATSVGGNVNVVETLKGFPDDGSTDQGGYLPDADIRDLDLVLGNVSTATGFPDETGGFNMLTATTFGRGMFAIRLDNERIREFAVNPNFGPIVQSTPLSPGGTGIDVKFAGAVDPQSLTTADVIQSERQTIDVSGPSSIVFSYNGTPAATPLDYTAATTAADIQANLLTIPALVTNEQQTIVIPAGVTGLTFNLDGAAAVPLTFGPTTTAAQVRANLETIPALGPSGNSNVSVSGANGGPYTVTFGNRLKGVDVSALQVTNVTPGSATIIVSETLKGGPNILVSNPSPGRYVVSFRYKLAGQDVFPITAVTDPAGTVTVTETTKGGITGILNPGNVVVQPTSVVETGDTGFISNASNTSPIVITSNNHGLVTGDQVTVSGVQGNLAANGTYFITVLSPNTFALNSSAGNGFFILGGARWTKLHNEFRVGLPFPRSPGFYSFVLGPDLHDFAGNFMNQDRDLRKGEVSDDMYEARVLFQNFTNAPPAVVTGIYDFATMLEDQAVNFGTDLAAWLLTLPPGTFTDGNDASYAPGVAPRGIAVTGLTGTANGLWQFSTDGGTNWTSFGTPSATSARLLEINGTTRIRFINNPNFNGTADFFFNAWDMTSGTNGGVGSTSGGGAGTSAFSSASATGRITILPVNDQPSFTKGLDQLVVEDSGAVTVPNWATNILAYPPPPALPAPDEDSQTFTFIVTPDDPSLFAAGPAISANGTLTFTPAPNRSGVATVTVVLQDSGGTANGGIDMSEPQTFLITITQVNDQPSFTVGPDQVVLEDAGLQTVPNWATDILPYLGAPEPPALDEANQVLTFLVSSDNPGLFSVQPSMSAAGTLTYEAAPHLFGVATVTVRLQDDGGTANGGIDTSAPQTFTIMVLPVNDPPSFTKGPDQTVLEDSGPRTVANWATQIRAFPAAPPPLATNETGQTVVFLVGSDNPALFSAGPAIAPDGTLTFTPAPNANGVATVTVIAQDDGGTDNGGVDVSAPQTFTITVVAVNDPPSFTKGPDQNVLEDAGPQTVPNWATDILPHPASPPPLATDEAGQTLTFLVSTDNPSLFAAGPAISATGTLTYTTAPNAHGSATVTVRLQDNGGTADGGADTSAAQTFTITVASVNDAPTFTKGPDQSILEDAGPRTVNNWATSILAYGTPPALDEAGQTLTFLVTTDNPALFAAGPAISSTGTLTYTTALNANGSATVTVVLQDNGGTDNGGVDVSAPQTFTITVTAVNDPPSFTKGLDQSVLEDAGPQVVDDWATNILPYPASPAPLAEDEAGQAVAFLVTNNNNALFSVEPAINPNGTLTYTPAPNAHGSATVTVRLQDNGGTADGGVDTSAAQTFLITVLSVNDAPSFTKGPDQDILEDAGPQSIPNWATDVLPYPASPAPPIPNEAAQALTFLVSTDNPALFASGPALSTTGTLTYTTRLNAHGSATVTVVLQDSGGTANGGVDMSAPQTFVITVTPVNDAPSFTKGPDQSVPENSGTQTIPNWATDILPYPTAPAPLATDEAGQTVVFLVSNDNPGLFADQPTISATGTLSYTPAMNVAGLATVTVRLQDDGGTANGGIDTSAAQTFTINVTRATVTDLTTSGSPTVIGQPVTFTATVTPALPGATPTGSITFVDITTGTTLGTVNLTSGVATLAVSSLTLGAHTITATYNSGPGFATSGDSAVHQVNAANTTVTLNTSANPAIVTTDVTFTAIVNVVAPGSAVPFAPTGNVVFFNRTTGTALGTVAVVGGQASLTTSALAVGSHEIEARFVSGNANFNDSAPVVLDQDVVNPVAFASVPANVASGAPFTVVVHYLVNGIPDLNFNGPITLRLSSNPGGGTLTGALTVNAVGGIATFTGLRVDRASIGYQLAAAASGLPEVFSPPFTVAPAALAARVRPARPEVRRPFRVILTARNSGGTVAQNFNGPVSLQLISKPTQSRVLGRLTGNFSSGVATLTGLRATKAGRYRFRATVGGLTVVFNVSVRGRRLS